MHQMIALVLLGAVLGLGRGVAAAAQTATMQTVSNPAGYQYQVPSDWVAGDVAAPTDTYMGSPTATEAAYVVVRQPAGATAADRLAALTASVLTPTAQQSAYVVTNPSSPVQVPGADAADGGAASFVDQFGTPGQEFLIAAVQGTTGYVLVVDVPKSVDAATPALAQSILGSFTLSPSSAAPADATAAAPSPAPATAAPPAAAESGPPVYRADFSAGSADWTPLRGTETVATDSTRVLSPGSMSLKVTTPGTDAAEGARVDEGSVTAGSVYSATVWVYAAKGTTLEVALGVSALGVYATDTFKGAGGWQRIALAGTSQATGENELLIRTSGSAQATSFWIASAEVDTGLAGG